MNVREIWRRVIQQFPKLSKELKGAGKALDFAGKFADGVVIFFDTASGISENIESGTRTQKIVSDALVDVGTGIGLPLFQPPLARGLDHSFQFLSWELFLVRESDMLLVKRRIGLSMKILNFLEINQ